MKKFLKLSVFLVFILSLNLVWNVPKIYAQDSPEIIPSNIDNPNPVDPLNKIGVCEAAGGCEMDNCGGFTCTNNETVGPGGNIIITGNNGKSYALSGDGKIWYLVIGDGGGSYGNTPDCPVPYDPTLNEVITSTDPIPFSWYPLPGTGEFRATGSYENAKYGYNCRP